MRRTNDEDPAAPRRASGADEKPGVLARAAAWLRGLAPKRGTAASAAGPQPRPGGAPTLRAGNIGSRAHTPIDLEAARLAADEGLSALAAALDHSDPAVRARAIELVSELTDESAKSLLKAAIHDPSPLVRGAAAISAGRTGSTDVVGSLLVALTDPDPGVRAAAAQAIAAITGRTVVPEGSDPALHAEAIEVFKRWWRQERVAELSRRLKA